MNHPLGCSKEQYGPSSDETREAAGAMREWLGGKLGFTHFAALFPPWGCVGGSLIVKRYRSVPAFLVAVFLLGWCTLSCVSQPQGEVAVSPPIILLNGTWRFMTDPGEKGEEAGWHEPGFDDSVWRTIKVPGIWEAQGVTDPHPGQPPKPLNGLPYTDYDGVAWYRRTVQLPADWRGENLLLTLGKIDDLDRTWFNGVLVGELDRGTVRTPSQKHRTYLVPAAAVRMPGSNVIAVRVTDCGGPGGIIGPNLSLRPESQKIAVSPVYAKQDAPLEERFRNPPSESRILPIRHNAAQRSDPEALVYELQGQGFGGMVTNMPFDKETYLREPQHWANLKAILDAGKKADLTFWLYDERGYPSGTAGGLTMEGHPEWQCEALLVVDADTSGHAVELESPPGTLIQAAAYPVHDGALDLKAGINLAGSMAGTTLRWTPPPGDWHVEIITRDAIHEGAHVSVALCNRELVYPNLLSREPTERFCEVTHEAYARELGNDLSAYFVSAFTDEPSLQTLWLKPMPYKPLPWSPDFADQFKARRGYDVQPLLPLLTHGTDSRAAKVRHDYWTTVGELVAENYFGVINGVCGAHGIKSGGHLLCEESICRHVPLYGDIFRCIRNLSAPSIDCLTSIPERVPWRIARLLSSAAELDGERETMCEQSDHVQRHRREGDTRPVVQVTMDQIRGSIHRLQLGGIHVVTSYYSFAAFNAEELQALNLDIGRTSTLLKGGHQVADLAVVYPSDSLCAAFVPSKHGVGDARECRDIERVYNNVSDGLFRACRDFTYVDARALVEARIDEGALRHGSLRWQAVILPMVDTLPLAAWRQLAGFWRSGGIIVACGALPTNSEDRFPCPEAQALAAELFPDRNGPNGHRNAAGGFALYLPADQELLLPVFLDALLERDVEPLGKDSPIRATHRRVDDRDVYLLANDSSTSWNGAVRMAGEGAGTLWIARTGETAQTSPSTPIQLSLGPYDAVVVTFPAARPRARVSGGAGQSAIGLSPLPASPAEATKGEFVEAVITPDPQRSTLDRPAWCCTGTLTKSDTDTFLFATFRFGQPQDMTRALGLELLLWGPGNQASPASCHVMVHDSAGHTWTAPLHVGVTDLGSKRLLVPFDSLHPASWVKQPEGAFDFTQVTDAVVGWGGYYGKKDERIEFSTALPALFSIGGRN